MASRKTLMVVTALVVLAFISVLVILSMLGGVDNYMPTTDDPVVVFQEACARCHGERGLGGSAIGPQLAGLGESEDEVKRHLIEGDGRMPSFPNIRGPALDNLAVYVHNLELRGEQAVRQTGP